MRFNKHQCTGVLVAQVCGTGHSCSHTKATVAGVASRLLPRLHLKISRGSFSVCMSAVTGSKLPDPHSLPSPLSEPGHRAVGGRFRAQEGHPITRAAPRTEGTSLSTERS